MVFVAGELLLAMAIPFVIIGGYHALLDSRAGTFVEEPTRFDPGWRALVDPTQVVGVAEVDQGTVTGVTLLVNHIEVQSSGTAILIPGSMEIDGRPISARTNPTDAVNDVGQALRLAISRVDILDDAGWAETLEDAQYTMDSPDPVMDEAGSPLFAVGPVVVDASNAAAFLGRPAPGAAPISVKFRRQTFWNAVIGSPPPGQSSLAQDLRAVDATTSQVLDLPTSQVDGTTVLSTEAAETMIRRVVAYPAGPTPGDRLQVRILDRTGEANLEEVAAAVASQGIEVLEIGNAAEFDRGTTEIIVPSTMVSNEAVPPSVEDLIRYIGTWENSAITDPLAVDSVVTVIIGRDFDLANLS